MPCFVLFFAVDILSCDSEKSKRPLWLKSSRKFLKNGASLHSEIPTATSAAADSSSRTAANPACPPPGSLFGGLSPPPGLNRGPLRRDLGVRPDLMNCVARVPDAAVKTRSNQRVQLRWEPVVFFIFCCSFFSLDNMICRPEPEVELTDISGQRVLTQGTGDIGFAIGEGVCQRRRESAEMPTGQASPSCRTCS